MAKPVGGVHITMSASAAKFEADMKRVRNAAKKSGAGFKKSFGQSKKATDSLTKSLGSLKGVIAGGLGVAAIIQFGKSAIKSFSEFESAMVATNTILNLTKEDLAKLSDEARVAAVSVGETPQGFATAVYQAVSAGVALDDVISTVTTATKLSKAGFTTTVNAVDLLTTVMNAYGDAVGDVTSVSDILLVTQNRGKTTIDQLAQSLGNLIPIAAALKVDFEVLSGAMATLTAAGINTAEATTALRALLNALSAPTSQQLKLWDKLGIEWNQARLGGDGLIDIIKELNEKTGGQTKLLTELGINQRALNGILALGGERIKEFTEGVEAARTATGTLATSYLQTVDTMDGANDRLTASLESLKIAWAGSFGPGLTKVISGLADIITLLGDAELAANKYGLKNAGLTSGMFGLALGTAAADKKLQELIDTMSLTKSLETAQASLKKINDEMETLEDSRPEETWKGQSIFAVLTQKSNKEINTQISLLGKQRRIIKSQITDIANLIKAKEKELELSKASITVTDNFAKSVDEWANSLNNVDSKTARKDLDDIIESGFEAEFIFERISTSVKNYTDSMQGFTATKTDVDTYVKTLLKMLQSNKDLKTSTDKLVKGAQAYAISLTQIAKDAGIAEAELQKLKDHQLARSGLSAEAVVPDMSAITESLKERLTREFEINKAAIIDRFTMEGSLTTKGLTKLADLESQFHDEIADGEADSLAGRLTKEQKFWRAKAQLAQDYVSVVSDIATNIVAIQTGRIETELQNDREAAQSTFDIRRAGIVAEFAMEEGLTKSQIIKLSTIELNALLQKMINKGTITAQGLSRLDALEIGHQATIANLEAEALERTREIAKQTKIIKIAQAISNTALGITSALAMLPPNLILAALVGAAGATQVAAIRAQPFAKGGVVGEETFFQMPRGKVGVMAEGDKAEAIMPLTRIGGDLGVKVELPEQKANNTFIQNNNFNGPVTSKRWINDEIAPILEAGSKKGFNQLVTK